MPSRAAAFIASVFIMEFHGIETSGDQYSMTPTLFNQVVDYVKQKGIPVVTVSQGAASLQ
jgi:hypothetical protein